MATLTGQQIDASYLGLLKTEDNGIIGNVAKGITDGQGGVTNMTVGTTSTNFVSGTVDFTGATVSGIPGALRAGSLEPDNFPNNFRNVATPGGTPTSSTAFGWQSMAFGHGANSQSARSIAIGIGAVAGDNSTGNGGTISMGWDVSNTGHRSVAIGGDNVNRIIATADDQVNIGTLITNSGTYSQAIGSDITMTGNNSVVIGKGTSSNGNQCVNIGNVANSTGGDFCTVLGYAGASGNRGLATGTLASASGSTSSSYGYYSNAVGIASFAFLNNGTASGPYSIGIGANTFTDAAATDGVAIGHYTKSSAAGAYALGNGAAGAGNEFIANRVDTVSVRKLAIEDISGGIIMKSPNGTEYTLTVSDAGALVIS
tara:strand:+ start:1589 stop:2701 length:1113 start_codon:yes stop_codon:yes gene_type:complete